MPVDLQDVHAAAQLGTMMIVVVGSVKEDSQAKAVKAWSRHGGLVDPPTQNIRQSRHCYYLCGGGHQIEADGAALYVTCRGQSGVSDHYHRVPDLHE